MTDLQKATVLLTVLLCLGTTVTSVKKCYQMTWMTLSECEEYCYQIPTEEPPPTTTTTTTAAPDKTLVIRGGSPATRSGDCTRDCTALEQQTPCFDPIVECNKTNPPTEAELAEYAAKYSAPPYDYDTYCDQDLNQACVRYTYYGQGGRGDAEAAINITWFCGKAVTDEGGTKLNECVTQETPGFTVEACMCTDNLCNGATNSVLHSFVILLLPTIAFLVAAY